MNNLLEKHERLHLLKKGPEVVECSQEETKLKSGKDSPKQRRLCPHSTPDFPYVKIPTLYDGQIFVPLFTLDMSDCPI